MEVKQQAGPGRRAARWRRDVPYGVTKVGPEVFPRSPNPTLNLSGMPKGYSAANSEYMSSTERKRLQTSGLDAAAAAAQYRA